MSQISPASCRKKRDSGNAYYTRGHARKVAKMISRTSGLKIDAFRCPHCTLWHTGKPAFKE